MRALLLAMLLLVDAPSAIAAEDGREPVQRELELVYVFEGSGDPEYVFVIGQAGFKSVAALKQHLERIRASLGARLQALRQGAAALVRRGNAGFPPLPRSARNPFRARSVGMIR